MATRTGPRLGGPLRLFFFARISAPSNMASEVHECPLHVSGLWIGKAVPHPSLSRGRRAVPTNPIVWSLSLVRPDAVQTVSAFGAGYFQDSADIQGFPVLTYSLRGQWEAASSGPTFGRVTLEKKYTHPGAADIVVEYDGHLVFGQGEANSGWSIVGIWTNEEEGTRGRFVARLVHSGD